MTEFDSVIPPGGQGKVSASIDTSRFKGRTSKSVSLYSNDPAAERSVLTLQAEILVAVDVQPRDRIVMRGKPSEMKPEILHVIATGGEVFDILSVDKRRDDLVVSVSPAPDMQVPKAGPASTPAAPKLAGATAVASGHSAYQVSVGLAPTAPPGTMADRIRLTTTHPKMPTIDINVSGRVEGNVTVTPERLFFLTRNASTMARQEVRIEKRPEGGLEIRSVTSSDPTFIATLVPISEGKEYRIEVRRSAEAIGSQAQARLSIVTNDPLQPLIEIPIVAR